MRRVILASGSPRRKQLLEQAGLDITVFPSNIKERPIKKGQDPLVYALALALKKAENVSQKFNDCIIIGADTIVVSDNKVFGKPNSQKHAEKILSSLSGKIQYVYTAIAVIDRAKNIRIVDIEKTTILAKKLSPSQIKELSVSNHDKAGAYAVQKDSDILVKEMKGDYYNVVGLPIRRLADILKLFSINLDTSRFG